MSGHRYTSKNEKVIEYSSPSGSGLISFHEVDGKLVVDLYQHDETVDIRLPREKKTDEA